MNYNKNTTNIYVFLYNSKNKQKCLYGAAAAAGGGGGGGGVGWLNGYI